MAFIGCVGSSPTSCTNQSAVWILRTEDFDFMHMFVKLKRYTWIISVTGVCGVVLFLVFWGALVSVHEIRFGAIDRNLNASAGQLVDVYGSEYGDPRDHGLLYMPDRGTEVVMMQCVAATRPVAGKRISPDTSAVLVMLRGAMGDPEALERMLSGDSAHMPVYQYSRYWHGYLTLLRPWLVIADYRTITIVNILLVCMAMAWAVTAVARRLSRKIALLFGITLILASPLTVGDCLQFIPCFMIMSLGCAVVLTWPSLTSTPLRLSMIFFLLGALTVFFDFLTTPIITLGFPAAMLLLGGRRKIGDTSQPRILLMMCMAWSAGYFGLWMAKWILAYLYGADSFRDIIQAVSLRAGSATGFPTFDEMMMPLTAVCIVLLVVSGFSLYYNKSLSPTIKSLLIVALLPVVWTLIARNHTLVHYYFTWRSYLLSFFCIGTVLLSLREQTTIELYDKEEI